MTEYDYSPDAYERYLASQQRIARWVDETQKYPPANPFLPSTTGSVTVNGGHHTSRSPQQSYSPPHGSSSPQGAYVGYRPTPVRTYSTPVTPQPEEDRRSRSRSKTMHTSSSSHHHHHGHSSSRHRSSHRHSRSSSVTPPSVATPPTYGYVMYNANTGAAMYPTNTANATMYPANTTSPVYSSNAASPTIYPSTATSPTVYQSNATSPTVVTQSATQPLVVQTPNGYVIVPPAGRRMEVMNAVDYVNSRNSKKEPDDKPFFKKIFGFGGLTQSNSRRSKSSHGSRKLRRRDSL